MNWSEATLEQLMTIAYRDDVSQVIRHQAAEEMKRRARQKYGRVNWRGKVVYPR